MPAWNAIACAAALLGLCACASAPALTLSGRTSLRTRRSGAAHTQVWVLGAALGWSADATGRGLGIDVMDAPEADAWDAELQPDAEAPCAFTATCNWEAQQRRVTLARAGAFESEEP